jgi:hypothetical protein
MIQKKQIKYRLMKKALVRFGVFLCFSVAILSCKKDDDEKPVLGSMTVDGRDYQLFHGAIFPPVQDMNTNEETIYRIDVILSGPADTGFGIDLISATETLESGTYTYTGDAMWESSAGTLYQARVTEGEVTFDAITGGTVVVEKLASDRYSFTVQTTINGKVMTAAFSGKVQLVTPG